jgi:hypothetical protein
VWSAPVTGNSGWTSVEVPFSALVAATQRGKPGPAFTGDGIVQIELGGTRGGGQRLWVEVDNITFIDGGHPALHGGQQVGQV